jgi:hypothetical protein
MTNITITESNLFDRLPKGKQLFPDRYFDMEKEKVGWITPTHLYRNKELQPVS